MNNQEDNKQLTIEELNQLGSQYYYQKYGGNWVICAMHANIKITYFTPYQKVLDLNNGGVMRMEERQIVDKQTIDFLVCMTKEEYDKRIKKDQYSSEFIWTIPQIIDIGHYDNLQVDRIMKAILDTIPENCYLIGEDELTEIARQNGYDQLEIEIKDMVKYPFCPEPSWKVTGYLKKRKTYTKK